MASNCACGSGEHRNHTPSCPLTACVEAMAKRLAALEAKSAIPPQPAPKLERPLAPGWQRLRAGNVGTCPCGGVAVFFYGENVVCCDAADCMRKLGVFATLLDEAESRGRNAAHGKAVKAWRELGAIERGFVVATIEMWRDDYRRHGLSEPFSHAMDVARAALAELAGTGDGK